MDEELATLEAGLGLSPTSVRGNLLDLEHVWLDANSPQSVFKARPRNLHLLWQGGLPYWTGLTGANLEALQSFEEQVGILLTAQGVRFGWGAGQSGWPPGQAPTQHWHWHDAYPAYLPLWLPTQQPKLRPRRPRYDHSHNNNAQGSGHPPVKVRWPSGGLAGLPLFLVEALRAEGIAAWPWSERIAAATRSESDYVAVVRLAVAAAPWFVGGTLVPVASCLWPEAVKHVAVAISKLDYYLFA